MPVNVLNYSGGKDSTALYLYALDRGRPFRAVFADTGNEHEATLEFVATIHEKAGGPKVETVKQVISDEQFERRRQYIAEAWPKEGVPQHVVESALSVMHRTGNPFLDRCLMAGRFPDPLARFCTRELKVNPVTEQVFVPIWRTGKSVVSWQGIRRAESRARALAPKWELMPQRHKSHGKEFAHRPLVDWSESDVWRMHRRHGIEPNPLYARGMARVGCMPCIYEDKRGLRTIATQWPEHIDRIREWEQVLSQAGKLGRQATFFLAKKTGGDRRGVDGQIDQVVAWANTSRGGKQYELDLVARDRGPLLSACDQWGGCE